jgi:hypothetical protein
VDVLGRGAAFRGLKVFLIVSWVLIASLGLIARRHLIPRTEVGISQLLAAFPSAHSFSGELKNPARRDAYGSDGSVLGSVVNSSELAPRVRGYSGSMSVLVGVARDGSITGAFVLEHNETPSYVRNLSRWVSTFAGRHVSDTLVAGVDVDAMTGATVTSKAVTDAVRLSSRQVASRLYGAKVPGEMHERLPRAEIVRVLLAIALFAVAILGSLRRKGYLRWVTLGLSLVLVGFVYNFQLSIVNLSSILSLKPSLSFSFWVLFGLSVLTAPVLGRIYCNWICPFGAAQEITHRIMPKKGAHSPPAHRNVEILKLVILWEITLAVILTANLTYADYEPFMTLFARRGTALLWLFVGAVLFFSLFRYRFWCRYFCALGGFYYLLSRTRVARRLSRGGVDDSEGNTE